MYCHRVNFFIYTFCFLYVILRQVESKAILTESSGNRGLYSESDNVIILNSTNFNSTILDSDTAHLVEFYFPWCGHCQKFAPIWKEFGKNISEWNDVVQLGVVDCDDNQNEQLCREHNIRSVPTIKYFSPKTILPVSLHVDKSEANSREELLGRLIEEQSAGKGPSWPIILRFRDKKLENVWWTAKKSAEFVFFYFEEILRTEGSELILDLHKYKKFEVRRVTADHQQLCHDNNVTNFPSLVALDRQNNRKYFNIEKLSPAEVANVIKKFMHLEDNDEIKIAKPTNSTSMKVDKKEESLMPDVLNLFDLESAVLYTLRKEIPRRSIIANDSMDALKDYLRVLSEYFPQEGINSRYIPDIYEEIRNLSSITSRDFRNIVQEKMTATYFNKKIEWFGCKGSSPEFRGPPCGLWTLFHTLTVRHADNYENEDPDTRQPSKVLAAMYKYVKNFFGCAECVIHFTQMAEERKLFNVISADDAVIWLWEAHNVVNDRLAKGTTGDPKFPKAQYPLPENCQACRNDNGSWNTNEVFSYLERKYGQLASNPSSTIKS